MNELKQKIALFIDADNAPASKFEDVLSEVAKYGVVTIRKAYRNFQTKSKNLKSDTKLVNLLRQAIEATEEDGGWAALGPVGAHISNKTSFDSRNYGFKNLSSLFKAIDLFELKRGPGNSYLVRDSRKKGDLGTWT